MLNDYTIMADRVTALDENGSPLYTFPYDLFMKYSLFGQNLGIEPNGVFYNGVNLTTKEFEMAGKYIQLYERMPALLELCEKQNTETVFTIKLTPNIFWSFHVLLLNYYHKGLRAIQFCSFPMYHLEYADYYNTLINPLPLHKVHTENDTIKLCSSIDVFMTGCTYKIPKPLPEPLFQSIHAMNCSFPDSYRTLWHEFVDLTTRIDECHEQNKTVNFKLTYDQLVSLHTRLVEYWNKSMPYNMQWGESDGEVFVEKYHPGEYQYIYDKTKTDTINEIISGNAYGMPSYMKLFKEHYDEMVSQSGVFDETTRLSVKLMNKQFFDAYMSAS